MMLVPRFGAVSGLAGATVKVPLPSDVHREASGAPALREITSTFAATMKDE